MVKVHIISDHCYLADRGCLPAVEAISHVAPAFHGFYRAVVCTPFNWTLPEWESLATGIASLFGPTATDHFNNLAISFLETDDTDSPSTIYLQMFISRYLNVGRPLTGYFMICCVVEIQWVVLSQTFSKTIPSSDESIQLDAGRGTAEAANTAWGDLTRGLLKYEGVLDDSSKECLESTLCGSMLLFTELVSHLNGMGADTSLETYAWETMAETLVG
jgi:phosphatidylinositol 4-kinase A